MSKLKKNWNDFRSKISWSEKIVDLAVVIIGISIAFGVDNCSRGQQNDETRSRYLRSLLIDLSKNSKDLEEAREGIVQEEKLIGKLLKLTYKDNLGDGLEIARTFSQVGSGKGNFEPQEYVYESLKSNGGVSLLSDSLNIKLNRLHSQYRAVQRHQDNLKLIIFDYAVPIFFNYSNRTQTISDPKLYGGPKFNNILLAVSGNIDNRRGTLEKTEVYLSDVESYIHKELGE